MVPTSRAFVGLSLATVAALILGACGVGEDAADTDNRDEKLGILCNATFTTTGTFTAAAPMRPAEVPTGCWPVGKWTFTAKLDSNECAATPTVLNSYAFKVDRAVDPDPTKDIGWVESYTYLGDQASLYRIVVSESGGGCEGGVELYSADGKEYWNWKPLLQDNGTITGFGEYAMFATSQR